MDILSSAKFGHLYFLRVWALIDEPMGSDIAMIGRC